MQILAPTIKEKTLSAQMFRLEVFSGPILVGYGYVFYHKYGMTAPTLINFKHEVLAEGWYQLRVSDQKPELVVMSRSIH